MANSPRPPADLGPIGVEVWRIVLRSQANREQCDRLSIHRFAKLTEERAEAVRILSEDGFTQTEPVQNSRGQVIGERLVAHPLLQALRGIDRALDSLATALVLTPKARADVDSRAKVQPEDDGTAAYLEGMYSL